MISLGNPDKCWKKEKKKASQNKFTTKKVKEEWFIKIDLDHME